MSILNNTKIKTPFFKISVGDSYGLNMVELPSDILKLVKKVEILETFEEAQFHTITITFIEGSKLGNRKSGYITDLKLDSFIKIPKKTSNKDPYQEKKFDYPVLGNKDYTVNGLNSQKQQNLENNSSFRTDTSPRTIYYDNDGFGGSLRVTKHPETLQFSKYLFQERNQIQVTWGYVEDPKSVRSIRGYVILINTEFPQDAQVETTITCQSSSAFLDQITLVRGKIFADVVKIPVDDSFIIDLADIKTEDLLLKMQKETGVKLIISKDLPAPSLGKGSAKIMVSGESVNEFFSRLAKYHNCYYTIIPDSQTGIDTIIFLKCDDFESLPIPGDPETFIYKAPGSIIKSVGIRADFGMPGGYSQTTINENGNVISETTDTGGNEINVLSTTKTNEDYYNPKNDEPINSNNSKFSPVYSEKHINTDPASSSNPIGFAENFVKNYNNNISTGYVNLTPDSKLDNLNTRAKLEAELKSQSVLVEITTIGYTKLTPGIVVIKNIGERYSGTYKLMTVTHVLDQSGYSCRASGTTYTINGFSGKSAVDANKIKEYIAKQTVQRETDKDQEIKRLKYNDFIYKNNLMRE